MGGESNFTSQENVVFCLYTLPQLQLSLVVHNRDPNKGS